MDLYFPHYFPHNVIICSTSCSQPSFIEGKFSLNKTARKPFKGFRASYKPIAIILLKMLPNRCHNFAKTQLLRLYSWESALVKSLPLGLGSLDSVKVATSLHDFILYSCGSLKPQFLLSDKPVLKMYSEGSIEVQDKYSGK